MQTNLKINLLSWFLKTIIPMVLKLKITPRIVAIKSETE